MTDQEILSRLEIRINVFEKAFNSLKELDEGVDYSDLEKAGFIQRFEFCFELSWKLIKSILDYNGISTKSPRDSIKEGLASDIIDEGDLWVDMQESKNILSHTYDQEKSLKVFEKLIQYIGEYEKLLEKSKQFYAENRSN
ncbi:nucleotidyltransferase [Candidatus Gracilibacteria bacterium]|nr:nucleotidyltransferase [Candidatus Gracilibacteria bacterium]